MISTLSIEKANACRNLQWAGTAPSVPHFHSRRATSQVGLAISGKENGEVNWGRKGDRLPYFVVSVDHRAECGFLAMLADCSIILAVIGAKSNPSRFPRETHLGFKVADRPIPLPAPTRAIASLVKVSKAIISIKNIPKTHRKRYQDAAMDSFTLLNSAVNLVLHRLSDLLLLNKKEFLRRWSTRLTAEFNTVNESMAAS